MLLKMQAGKQDNVRPTSDKTHTGLDEMDVIINDN